MYILKSRFAFGLEELDETWFKGIVDDSVLGYYIGETVICRAPAIEGLPEDTSIDQLKAFSATAVSGDAVYLFHAVSLTPEALLQKLLSGAETDISRAVT
ncbi:MAG: DUF521 domain-containing protein [Mogibacterium sp.]|nr:DUF521 domain-containing protein [Mogibacterium sp.]